MGIDYLAKMLMEEVESLKPKAEAYDKLMSQDRKKVFVVTSGDYEDYSVEAVFSCEDKAKEYCEVNNVGHAYPYYSYSDYLIDDYEVKYPVTYEVRYMLDYAVDDPRSMEFCRDGEHSDDYIDESGVFWCSVEYNKDFSAVKEEVLRKYLAFTEQQKGTE